MFSVFVLFITSVAVVFVWLETRVDQKPTFECLQEQKREEGQKPLSPQVGKRMALVERQAVVGFLVLSTLDGIDGKGKA